MRFLVWLAVVLITVTKTVAQNETWTVIDSSTINDHYLNVDCGDSLHCATCVNFQGRVAIVRVTDDGGKTWREVFGDSTLYDNVWSKDTIRFKDIARPSGELIVALADRCRLLLSNDSGSTWRTIQVENTEAANYISMCDTMHGALIMFRRRLALTNDGWKSWWIVTLPDTVPSGLFYKGMYADSNTVYVTHFEDVVGTASLIRYRVDRDEWTVHYLTDDLNAIDFIDSSRGWMAGPQNRLGPWQPPFIRSTNDGGSTWESRPIDPSLRTPGLVEISFSSPNVGYVSGATSYILRTTDGGESWAREDLDMRRSGNVFVAALTDSNAVAVTSEGIILRRGAAGTAIVRAPPLPTTLAISSRVEFKDNTIQLLATAQPGQGVSCSLANALGQILIVLPDKRADDTGHTEWLLSVQQLPPGLYLARVVAGNDGTGQA